MAQLPVWPLILYGVLLLIGVDPAHPMATLGLILLASWTFMALVTALVGWNNRLVRSQV
jgi:putative membrane protein